MYLIVNLVFSNLGFWSGNFILIAPFPAHCLLVHFFMIESVSGSVTQFILTITNQNKFTFTHLGNQVNESNFPYTA